MSVTFQGHPWGKIFPEIPKNLHSSVFVPVHSHSFFLFPLLLILISIALSLSHWRGSRPFKIEIFFYFLITFPDYFRQSENDWEGRPLQVCTSLAGNRIIYGSRWVALWVQLKRASVTRRSIIPGLKAVCGRLLYVRTWHASKELSLIGQRTCCTLQFA